MKSRLKYCVLMVDDHSVVRAGVAHLLSGRRDMALAAEAEDGPSGLEALRRHRPDIVILDPSVQGGGLELIRRFKALSGAKLLVFSGREERVQAEEVLRAGADGYLLKKEPAERLIEALHELAAGRRYVSAAVEARLLAPGAPSGAQNRRGFERLSRRELQVLRLLGRGLGTREIAGTFGISVKTVESHREHIKHKLELSGASELLRCAIQWVRMDEGR